MSCNPTVSMCARGCQDLVAQLYVDCDGVTMPDRFNFGEYVGPDGKTYPITGKWNNEVKAQLKIEIERCGCSAAMRGAAGSPLVALALAAFVTYAVLGQR